MTQFSVFVPCDEGDDILTGAYSFNVASDDIVVVQYLPELNDDGI
ncbi:MAG TPA: hypothetical protein VF084_02895 [Nitrososphaeraceae archaeon]